MLTLTKSLAFRAYLDLTMVVLEVSMNKSTKSFSNTKSKARSKEVSVDTRTRDSVEATPRIANSTKPWSSTGSSRKSADSRAFRCLSTKLIINMTNTWKNLRLRILRTHQRVSKTYLEVVAVIPAAQEISTSSENNEVYK